MSPKAEKFESACGQTRHSVKDAAWKHGRSVSDIRVAIKSNELEAIKVGRTWTIRCKDVEEWIERVGIPNAAELERGR